MNKHTPVTPIDAYVSIQCAGRRHSACPPSVACACTCHHGVSEIATLAPAVGSVEHGTADDSDHAGASFGAAETQPGDGQEGKGSAPSGSAIAYRRPVVDEADLQACVDRHPSGRTNSSQ